MPDNNKNNGFYNSILQLLAQMSSNAKTAQTPYKEVASDKNLEMLSKLILASLDKDFQKQKTLAFDVANNPSIGAGKYSPVPVGILQNVIPDSWIENARNQAYSSQVAKYLFGGDMIPSDMRVPQDKLQEVESVVGKQNTADALARLAWQQKQYMDFINSGADRQQRANDAISGVANDEMNQLEYGIFNPNALGYYAPAPTGGFDTNKMRAFADTLYNTAKRIK